LIYFDQFALVAECPEPAHPMEIKLDRAPRQMASSPKLDDGTFAVITKSHIHTFMTDRRWQDYQDSMTFKPATDGAWEARLWIKPESG
jgi:hypothetical protein